MLLGVSAYDCWTKTEYRAQETRWRGAQGGHFGKIFLALRAKMEYNTPLVGS